MEQSELPLESLENRPAVSVHLNGGLVVASGVVVTASGGVILLNVAGLSLELKFEDDGREQPNVKVQESSERGATLVLQNFRNPLGSALRPIKVATVSGKPTYLGIGVHAVGDATRLVHYTVIWGGDHDR